MKIPGNILKLPAYGPGKAPNLLKKEFGLTSLHLMTNNENPLGPSKKAVEAIIAALSEVHRYPEASAAETRQRLAAHFNVAPALLAIGNGSIELIDLLLQAFCEAGDSVLSPKGSFIAYKFRSQVAGVNLIETKMTAQFGFDVNDLVHQANQPQQVGPKMVFIANPNNPTGSYLNRLELNQILEAYGNRPDVLVVLDEAYIEYGRATDLPNGLDLFPKYTNLIILRTVSKAYGLAGLRFGFMLAPSEVIDLVNRVRNPFNVNSLAMAAAAAAVEDVEHLRKVQSTTWTGIDYLTASFQNLGLKVTPSQTNFVMVDTGTDADAISIEMIKSGVLVRPLTKLGFPGQLRVTVGLPAENEAAVKALKKALAGRTANAA